MICPNCGQDSLGKFCPFCGAKMPAPETSAAVPETAAAVPETAAAVLETVAAVPETAAAVPETAAAVPEYAVPVEAEAPVTQAEPVMQTAPVTQAEPVMQAEPVTQAEPVMHTQPVMQTEHWEPPANQLVRKLGSSGLWLTATLAATLAFLISLYLSVFDRGSQSVLYLLDTLPGLRDASSAATAVVNLFSIGLRLLFAFVFVLLLWIAFGSAAGRRGKPLGTGALTASKVFVIISLVFVCFCLAVVFIFFVMTLFFGSRSGLGQEVFRFFNRTLRQYRIRLSYLHLNRTVLAGILLGLLLLINGLALVCLAKVLKSLNTVKRVIRSGRPDDRVSPLAAVIAMLFAGLLAIGGFWLLAAGSLTGVLSGILLLLNAVSLVCLALLLFRFRSGMRQLGVRKGVMQRPA